MVIKRGGKPKARIMPGFASVFQKGEEKEAADETEEVGEEAEAEAEGEEDEEKAAKGENKQELGWARGNNKVEIRRGYGQQVYSSRRMASPHIMREARGPRAREMEGFADFGEPVRDDDEEYQADKEEAIAEGNDMPQHLWDVAGRPAEHSRGDTEMETRWVLGSRPRRAAESSAEAQEGHGKEGFRQAFVRNMRAVVARRTGERVRKPTQFFDEERMLSAAADGNI